MTETQIDDLSQVNGEAEDWDDEAVLLLALLTFADVAGIARFWDAISPRRWKGLLLALAVANRGAITDDPPRFWFDITRQRFGTAGRGYIPRRAIRVAATDVVKSATARLIALADQLIAGGLSIAEFQSTVAAIIKPLTLAMTAVGRGGVERVTGAAMTAAQDSLEFELKRLARFAAQIEAKSVTADTPEKILRRIGLYAQVAGNVFDEAQRVSHVDAGFDEERRILNPAEHCPECPELAAMGWVEISTLPSIGDTICLWNCKCEFEFRRSNGEENRDG